MISKKDLTAYGSSASEIVKGAWTNELGSTMTITSVKGGVIKGTYVSDVSEDGETTVEGVLTGFIADDAITFIVNWNDPVTSWTGRVLKDDSGKPYIFTLWHLALHSNTADWWKSIQAGSDVFVRSA